MNENITALLENGEKILFSTKAEKFDTLDKTNKSHILRKMILALGITVAFIVFYVVKALETGGIKWGLIVILAFLGGFIAFSDFLSSRKVRKLEYVITNKRVIAYGESDKSLFFKDINKYNFSKDDDNHVSLLIGEKALAEPSKKWRLITDGPIDRNEDTQEVLKYAFYAIEDAKKFEKTFEEAMAAVQ